MVLKKFPQTYRWDYHDSITAIFDLDGTLTKRDTYLPFLWLCLRQFGLRKLSVVVLPLYVLLYKLSIISNHQLKEIFLSKILFGISLEQLEPIAEKFVFDLIDRGLNRPIFEILNLHLKHGHKVILVTASFDFYVIKLARKIGINHVVCTRAEVNDGILTGRILGKNCHGEEKVRRLENLLSESDWDFSVLYTDHYSDYPLLKKVNKGILVEPGFKTRSLLKKDNITIMQ
jgi:HAD superfamily hydrolase (TIGR01490 family)